MLVDSASETNVRIYGIYNDDDDDDTECDLIFSTRRGLLSRRDNEVNRTNDGMVLWRHMCNNLLLFLQRAVDSTES